MPKPFYIADLFCGAGGSSKGALRALTARDYEPVLVAMNHWDVAIATHRKNLPKALHFVEDVTTANPNAVVPGGYLDALLASPECIFHSRAAGGRPKSNQGRMAAWAVQRWVTALDVQTLLVENVPEFVDWGPLDAAGHPIKAKKGVYFQAWANALRELGYDFRWEYLNAADYGEATTRVRFFGIGRKDGRRVMFPTPTHKRRTAGTARRPSLFEDGRLPWRAGLEVIDLENRGRSLFDHPAYRRKPLSVNTRKRIARGLLKFNGPVIGALLVALLDLPPEEPAPTPSKRGAPSEGFDPFVAVTRQNNLPRPVGEPLQTVTTIPAMGLVQPGVRAVGGPFILPQRSNDAPRSAGEPLPTLVTVTRQALLEGTAEPVAPFVLGQHGGGAPRSPGEPLPTVTTDGAISLTTPVLVPVLTTYNGSPRGDAHALTDPVPTVTTRDRFALVRPMVFVVGRHTSGTLRGADEPVPTVTTSGAGAVVEGLAEPFLLSKHSDFDGTGGVPARSLEDPLYSPTTQSAPAVVEPFITAAFGEKAGQLPRVHDLREPIPTVTGQGVSKLVSPTLVQVAHTQDPDGHVFGVDVPLPTITTRNNTLLASPDVARVAGPVLDPEPAPVTGLPLLAVPDDFDVRRLVVIDGVLCVLNIFYRMLQNPELARAMGFDDEDQRYEFAGNKGEVTMQIGNAVSVRTAEALMGAIADSPPLTAAELLEAAG